MSIFDRLKSNLSSSDAAPEVAAAPAEDASKPTGGRFMGKDDSKVMYRAERDVPERPVEKLLTAPGMVWVFVCPNTQRLILVSGLGVAQGEVMTHPMLLELQRCGLCEEVSYHAGYDQYWKMPTQTAIMRMPGLHGVEALPMRSIQLTTQLVKAGEPRGFWMRVRLREDAELPQHQATAEDSRVG